MKSVRARDRLAHWLTFHVPGVYRLRSWRADRGGRPGFRAWEE